MTHEKAAWKSSASSQGWGLSVSDKCMRAASSFRLDESTYKDGSVFSTGSVFYLVNIQDSSKEVFTKDTKRRTISKTDARQVTIDSLSLQYIHSDTELILQSNFNRHFFKIMCVYIGTFSDKKVFMVVVVQKNRFWKKKGFGKKKVLEKKGFLWF